MEKFQDSSSLSDTTVQPALSPRMVDTTVVEPASTSGRQAKPSRLLSIDALRGFDMLMITGGGALLLSLRNKTGMAWVDAIAEQFEHPAWHGFTFYDFIFPLFLFVAGVSLPFSLHRALALGMSKSTLYRKAFWRMVILLLLGMLDKNAPFPFFEPSQIRLGTVLGRIGIAGFVTTLLYLNLSWRSRLSIVGFVLLAYYA